MMYVEASDIDNDYSEAPIGANRTNVLAAMAIRGQTVLKSSKGDVLILKQSLIRNSTN